MHGDPVGPERTASLLDTAGDEYPHVRAAASALRASTAERILETELDMFVHAVTAVARG